MSDVEIWKPVKEYESSYKVSNLGNVFSIKSNKLLKFHYGSCGYLNVFLYNGHNKKKTKKIHRLVATAFLPNPEQLKEVNHKDGNKRNNTIINLEWVTSAQNVRHAFDTGLRTAKGESNNFSKLSETEVKLIRKLKSEGHPLTKLSKQFNVSPTTICDISKYKTWKHI